MDPRLQMRVQRYGWDKAAALYEECWREQLRPAQDKLMEMAALSTGERVLDIACGTGLVTLRAARAVGETGSVIATDISDEMIRAVQENATDAGLRNVSAVRAAAESIELPESSVDVVLCALGLMYVTDPSATLREAFRVLRPGGRLVAAVWGARRNCGWAEIFPIVDSRVRSEVCPMFFQLGTGDSLALAMSGAGFSELDVHRLSTVLEYENAAVACAAAFAGGPVALAYSRFTPTVRREAEGEYLASIEQYRGGTEYRIPGEFVVALGVRPSDHGNESALVR